MQTSKQNDPGDGSRRHTCAHHAPCRHTSSHTRISRIAHSQFTCALALVAAAGWGGAGAMTRRPIPQTNYRYPNNKSRRHPECANTFPSISGRPLTRPYMLYTEPIYSCRYRCTSTRGKTHTRPAGHWTNFGGGWCCEISCCVLKAHTHAKATNKLPAGKNLHSVIAKHTDIYGLSRLRHRTHKICFESTAECH